MELHDEALAANPRQTMADTQHSIGTTVDPTVGENVRPDSMGKSLICFAPTDLRTINPIIANTMLRDDYQLREP